MATDYSKRLSNLRTRRLGLSAPSYMVANDAKDIRESYEGRTSARAIKYTIGSMAEVDQAYTNVGLEEAERVGQQLKSGLLPTTKVTFELQGSVALNVHIRGTSDVDLLVLHDGFVTADPNGVGTYVLLGGSVSDDMPKLRKDAENILTTRYWGATVDITGAKAIRLSGGAFRREVDVVPAYWFDTAAYQISREKHDREVRIYRKDNGEVIKNSPFMFMKRINEKDLISNGGLKKSIRLLKNLVKDAEEDGKSIALTSYDIASIMWNCNANALNCPARAELPLLAIIQAYLESLVNNQAAAMQLITPDGSRVILNEAEKFASLVKLYAEVKDLANVAADEVKALSPYSIASGRDLLVSAVM